jgi:hypothetical protein
MKKCKEENCNKQPSFNLPDEKVCIYCKEHSKINMINVKAKKCLEENCYIIPTFNLQDKKTGIYCKEHSKIDMVNVKSKICLENNCNKPVSYTHLTLPTKP